MKKITILFVLLVFMLMMGACSMGKKVWYKPETSVEQAEQDFKHTLWKMKTTGPIVRSVSDEQWVWQMMMEDLGYKLVPLGSLPKDTIISTMPYSPVAGE